MVSFITSYIINRFDSDNLVNTITLSDTPLIDTKKENIYLLVNVKFNGKRTDDDFHLYDYTIHILQQRDSNRKMKPSKLMEETNYMDNLNECESVANNFINYIRRFEIDLNINIESLSQLEPLSQYGGANLDGFTFDITLSLPNTGYCAK